MSSIFTTKVDLALQLIDTTLGASVNESEVSFRIPDGKELKPMRKGEGTYLFLNQGRENFSMTISVKGYEEYELSIDYEELDQTLPMKEVFLIPSENAIERDGFLTLKGSLQGLREISLVMLREKVATTDSYDSKKKILTVFEKGYRVNTEGSPFGLVNMKEEVFEPVYVKEQTATNAVVLKNPLGKEFIRNAPVIRVIYGYVKDNRYILRIRNNSSVPEVLIRVVTDKGEQFCRVNMAETGELPELTETKEGE